MDLLGVSFETVEGGDGGGGTAVAVPPVDTSLFAEQTPPDPAATPVEGEQPEGFDPAALEQRLREGLTSDLGELFRSSLAPQPPAYQPQPVAQPHVEQPQQSKLDVALANFDPFNGGSLKDVLAAQAEDLRTQFAQELQSMRGEYAPMVNEHINTQGEQMAKAELSGFEGHIGFAFDHDDAISAARNLLAQNPDMSERDALWYGANQVAQKERAIGLRYVTAYREHLNTLANAGEGEPPAAPATGELDLSDDRYQGSGKYARLVKDRIAADRQRAGATV